MNLKSFLATHRRNRENKKASEYILKYISSDPDFLINNIDKPEIKVIIQKDEKRLMEIIRLVARRDREKAKKAVKYLYDWKEAYRIIQKNQRIFGRNSIRKVQF